jgi:integrase
MAHHKIHVVTLTEEGKQFAALPAEMRGDTSAGKRASNHESKLKTRTGRASLPSRGKPYKGSPMAPGIYCPYRKPLAGPGSWSYFNAAAGDAGKLKKFALADDVEPANGITVMDRYQARAHALKLVRGSEISGEIPTVGEALDAFKANLKIRGGIKYNVSSVRHNLPPALLNKSVDQLTPETLEGWREGLVTEKGLKGNSAHRYAKTLKAALNFAAGRNTSITNAAAWKEGLKHHKVQGESATPRDYYQPDAVINAIVRESHVEGADFGALIATLAVTGTRESQALKLRPHDLLDDDAAEPRLMLWCSRKGKNRDPEQRAVPITPKLAQLLRARAIARGPNRPLFDRVWGTSKLFRGVLERLKLDTSMTPYLLRHSSIVRQLRSGKPTRFVAFCHDTSAAEIEKTYSRRLNNAGAGVERMGLLADDVVPAGGNVVSLARKIETK